MLSLNGCERIIKPQLQSEAQGHQEFPVETDEDVDKLLHGTRRVLLGKSLELFDILGLWEPLNARLKFDLQALRMYDYDDINQKNLETSG